LETLLGSTPLWGDLLSDPEPSSTHDQPAEESVVEDVCGVRSAIRIESCADSYWATMIAVVKTPEAASVRITLRKATAGVEPSTIAACSSSTERQSTSSNPVRIRAPQQIRGDSRCRARNCQSTSAYHGHPARAKQQVSMLGHLYRSSDGAPRLTRLHTAASVDLSGLLAHTNPVPLVPGPAGSEDRLHHVYRSHAPPPTGCAGRVGARPTGRAHERGHGTLTAIADGLHPDPFFTTRGTEWRPGTARLVLAQQGCCDAAGIPVRPLRQQVATSTLHRTWSHLPCLSYAPAPASCRRMNSRVLEIKPVTRKSCGQVALVPSDTGRLSTAHRYVDSAARAAATQIQIHVVS
jgi:hypothetical protein